MITSTHNPKIQAVRKLQAFAKVRREERAFVIEGVRLAEEALQSAWEARLVLFTEQLDDRGKALVNTYAAQGVPSEMVSEAVMKGASETETPQGLLVVLAHRALPIPTSPDFLLILDGLHDPGNLGTILRTAAAAGVEAVLLSQGCADAWSPKVLRAAMGAHFHLPMQELSWPEIRHILKRPTQAMHIYLADSASGIPYTQADFQTSLVLIVGGEASGAGKDATSLADAKVHIPMPGGSESLNAAVAASILLFEIVRQRARG